MSNPPWIFEADDYYNRGDDDNEEWDEWGCVMPDRCLMPEPHRTSECYDAEWLEQYIASDDDFPLAPIED